MKKVQETHLHYQKGTSNKVYNVFLIQVSNNQYLVNFEYGRSGSKLREGTKTTNPVALEQAQKIYDSLVVSKINKEYEVKSGFDSLKQEAKKERKSLSSQEYKALLLERLSRAGEVDTTVTTEERTTGGATGFRALHTGRETITHTTHSLKKVDNYDVSRLIYKAGTLKLEEAKPYILNLYQNKADSSNAFYYAVAWALGRLKDPSLVETIESLREILDDSSRYIVEEALFLLKEPEILEQIDALTLPIPFSASLRNEDTQAFLEQVKVFEELVESKYKVYKEMDSWYRKERKQAKEALMPYIQRVDELFLKLYIIAVCNDFAHKIIVKSIAYLPINEFNFSLFRRLYKMAEMRDDYAVLGALITKIESKRMACFTAYDENWNTKPSLGCSRLHFKKRSLRYLNALAIHDGDAYISFAKGVLLSMNDYPTEFEAYTTEFYDENWNWKTKQYDPYAVHLTFMSILFGEGKRYMLAPSKKVWEIANKNINDEVRPERYPELWNEHTKEVLEILLESSVEVVQKFAFTILKEKPEVLNTLEIEKLVPLLSLSYDEARELFFLNAKVRYEQSADERLLRGFLLSSDHAIATYGLAILQEDKSLVSLKGLISDVTLKTSENIFFGLLKLLKEARLSEVILEREIAVILADKKLSQRVYSNRVIQLLKEVEMKLGVEEIALLLPDIALDYRHLFAAKLIREGCVRNEELSVEIKEKIAGYSDTAEMLATTIYLLGELDDEALMQEHRMLISFLYQEEVTVHSEASKILKRLGTTASYAHTLLAAIIDNAFQSASDEVREVVVTTVESLSLAFETLQENQLYRLLIAKSKLANALGAKILEAKNAEAFSVKQWARLAKNPHGSVRKWAYEAYSNNLEKVQEAMPVSLMIFDTHWEDTRAFACAYFENFEKLSSDDVVVIADSNYDDVQQFAKKLIEQREFELEVMLSKLSQHPALSIQKFVTDLMLSGMEVAQLLKMERFFNTLLHSVNSNRVAKTRVMQLLLAKLENKEIAQMYARLASHHAATMVWADKAMYMEAMVEIAQRHEEIELPMAIQESEVKEVNDGV